jgi:ATP-dependent RNA helicase RhlE
LSPTRELAAQIGDSFRTYGRHLGVKVAVVFGGVAHKPQIDALAKGVDVLVATPGRLLDHIDSRALTLEAVEALVLDEADQMLDLGFVRPIRRIVSKLRARRQNLFFSATMPHEIAALAAELLEDPVRVQVTPVATTAERVSQRVIHIEANKKRPMLVNLFGADPAMSRTLVFTRTKRGADRVARHLEAAGIAAVAIHGNKSQRQREVALDQFRKAKTGVLVATDIAARGIDIDGVTHVVNYELPEVPEAYVHRIGRTARAGAEGHAISLCDVEERDLLRAIERLTRQQIPAEDRRNDASIVAEIAVRGGERDRDRGRGRGERPSSGRHPARGERKDSGERGGARGERRGAAVGNAGSGGGGRGRDGQRRDDVHKDRRHSDSRGGDGRPAANAQRDMEPAGGAQRHGDRRDHGRPERQGDRDRNRARGNGAHRSGELKSGAAHGEGNAPDRRKTHGSQSQAPRNGERGHDQRRSHQDGSGGRGDRRDGAAVAHVFSSIDGRKGGGKPAGKRHAGGHGHGGRHADSGRSGGGGQHAGRHGGEGRGKSHGAPAAKRGPDDSGRRHRRGGAHDRRLEEV